MYNMKSKLRNLSSEDRKTLMNAASEAYRSLEELEVQITYLEKVLDIQNPMMYNKSYIGNRVRNDLEFYKNIDEGFRNLAHDSFEEGDID